MILGKVDVDILLLLHWITFRNETHRILQYNNRLANSVGLQPLVLPVFWDDRSIQSPRLNKHAQSNSLDLRSLFLPYHLAIRRPWWRWRSSSKDLWRMRTNSQQEPFAALSLRLPPTIAAQSHLENHCSLRVSTGSDNN